MSAWKGFWQQTYSGRKYYPADPRPEDVDLADIAQSLSNQCRFAGHCADFYSVAQHSVHVSRLAQRLHEEQEPSECSERRIIALWGLLHDAEEAYVSDLINPMKWESEIGEAFRRLEDLNMKAVCAHFGLHGQEPAIVNYADRVLLSTEKRDLMSPAPGPWVELPDPLQEVISPWAPARAKQAFLARYIELTT